MEIRATNDTITQALGGSRIFSLNGGSKKEQDQELERLYRTYETANLATSKNKNVPKEQIPNVPFIAWTVPARKWFLHIIPLPKFWFLKAYKTVAVAGGNLAASLGGLGWQAEQDAPRSVKKSLNQILDFAFGKLQPLATEKLQTNS